MTRFVTARDLPNVLSLRDASEWSGVSESVLLYRLRTRGDVATPDGMHEGSPLWLSTTLLRWRPHPQPGRV